MRSVLIMSGLLVCAGSSVGAEGVRLSGDASAGIVYDSGATDGQVSPFYEVDLMFTGAGRADNGLDFGAIIELEETGVDEASVFLSGRFGTLAVGNLDAAPDGFGIADIGFSELGVADLAEQYKNATAEADVRYTYTGARLTVIASAEFGDDRSVGLAAEYVTGPVSFGLGYIDDADSATNTFNVAAGYSFGPVAVNGLYSDWSAGGQGYGVDVTVETGSATVTAAWAQARGVEADPEEGLGDAYGIGVSVPLSTQLTLSGGLGRIDTDAASDGARTVADFGVTMNF